MPSSLDYMRGVAEIDPDRPRHMRKMSDINRLVDKLKTMEE